MSSARMRVLATGATGFIGSHLVQALLSEGHEVRVLARRTSNREWLRDLPLIWHTGDVCDPGSLCEAVRGVDWVFHLAGLTKAHGYRAYFSANTRGTANLFEASVQQDAPPRKFIFLSSLAASGPSTAERPKRETDPCSPVSHYGCSKLKAERIARSYSDLMPVVILRPPVVYGPRDRDTLAFFRMIRRGYNVYVGARESRVSMIHVSDLVDALLLAAQSDLDSGSTLFVSDGSIHLWREVAGALERIMGVKTRSVRVPLLVAQGLALAVEVSSRLVGFAPLLNRQKIREIKQRNWTCEIDLARKSLGFEPMVPLEKGLRETYSWYLERGWV